MLSKISKSHDDNTHVFASSKDCIIITVSIVQISTPYASDELWPIYYFHQDDVVPELDRWLNDITNNINTEYTHYVGRDKLCRYRRMVTWCFVL